MAAGWIYLVCIVLVHQVEAAHLTDAFYNVLRNLLIEKSAHEVPRRPIEVPGWGRHLNLGQVTGVSVNPLGQPVVFHRGTRTWHPQSFNESHHYQEVDDGPIQEDVVVTLDPEDGSVLSSWGGGLFYLPHGITVDHEANTWLTDVALHQVFKFPVGWRERPSLRLGERFQPGSGSGHLCKPTSVAVAASTGEVFVADGYCNSRILKFNHAGRLKRTFPHYGEFLSLMIPHSVALVEPRDLACVADRENMRVVCFKAELGESPPSPPSHLPTLTIHQPDLARVYAIASNGNLVYAVNGPTSTHIPVQGFTLDPMSELIIDHWGPQKQRFTEPHDIAVSPQGDALYVSEINPNRLWKFTLRSSTT